MPPMDYSKSIIYKVCCNDISITDIYIGSTTNFRNRKSQHKNCCNNENDKKHNYKIYQFIRENGGFDNWNMIMIEEYNCENKRELEKRERYWIEELKSNLNSMIPTRTHKEYVEQNKDKISESNKQRYNKNIEERKNKRLIYYYANKEKSNEYCKEYYEKKKTEISNKRREDKIICECGSVVRKGNLKRHYTSKKHLQFKK